MSRVGRGKKKVNQQPCRVRKEHLCRHWDKHHRSSGCVLSLASHSLCLPQGYVPLRPHPWGGAALTPPNSGQEEGASLHEHSSQPHLSADGTMKLDGSQKMSSFHHLKKQRWIWCLTEGQSFQILKCACVTLTFFLGMGLTKTGPLSASP